MPSRVWLAVAALVGFGGMLVARLPAKWIAPLLPPAVRCAAVSGSAWNGACRDARFTSANGPALELGLLRWDLQPLQLLTGRITAQVDVASPALTANARVSATFAGRLVVRDLVLAAGAGAGGLPVLPPGWQGSVRIRDTSFELDRQRLYSLSGKGEVLGLASVAGDQLGGYRVDFPAATAAALGPGHVEDAGDGPLDIDASLTLDPAMSWQIDGSVSATPRASESLQRWIQYLGTPDAAGKRPFSLSGALR